MKTFYLKYIIGILGGSKLISTSIYYLTEFADSIIIKSGISNQKFPEKIMFSTTLKTKTSSIRNATRRKLQIWPKILKHIIGISNQQIRTKNFA
jgi:hypothetical protein